MSEAGFLAGSRAGPLGESVVRQLGVEPIPAQDDLFPDGERHLCLAAPVRGRDVFLLQPTSAPVGESLLEILLLADAARRSGAKRLFAVVPYFGDAWQDRRKREGEPVALIHKTRLGGGEVSVEEIAGPVRGRTPFVVDDMISTGGAIAAALEAAVAPGARPDAVVAAVHGVFAPGSSERLASSRIRRLHGDRPLSDLISSR